MVLSGIAAWTPPVTIGDCMIPLLTLGIPGSTVATILIGVFLIRQVSPTIFESIGPNSSRCSPPVWWASPRMAPSVTGAARLSVA